MTETTGKLGVTAFVAALLERDGLRTTKGTVSKAASAGKIPCSRDEKGHPVFDYEPARDAFLALDPAKRIGAVIRDAVLRPMAPVAGPVMAPAEPDAEAAAQRPRSLSAVASQEYIDTKNDQAKLKFARELVDFAKEVGALVRAADVETACSDAVQALRESLRVSRDPLSATVAPLDDPAAIRRLIAERDEAAMTAFVNALDQFIAAAAPAAAA